MNSEQIWQKFQMFFEDRGHQEVPSSSVVPSDDPTLLFTNAGMNQFKPVLLGETEPEHRRVFNAQKCIRAGGKHNDLDEVGKDGRHLTFFEMLGNWSFDDYGKDRAIDQAWSFLLEELELEQDRLYVTVHESDQESYDYWKEVIGVNENRILRLDKPNFWSMGSTGPCGPCTEIHYDLHPERGSVGFEPGYDEERIVEVWNLVFISYNRDEEGNLEPLPLQSVDTGMGLERIAMIMAGSDNVFKTDLFEPIFEAVVDRIDDDEGFDDENMLEVDSDYFPHLAVIGDHIRTLMFAICDGAKFANTGKGYVLRRILRRAVRFGRELGFDEPFLYQIGQVVINEYGSPNGRYPELRQLGDQACEMIRREEQRFFQNIDRGILLFENTVDQLRDEGQNKLSGEKVFEMHTTHGFPPDLVEIMAGERGLSVDWEGYEELWEQHQQKSQQEDGFQKQDKGSWKIISDRDPNEDPFVGYTTLEKRTQVEKIRQIDDQEYELVLVSTPFYAESGGQVADQGIIYTADHCLKLEVVDVQKTSAGIVHRARKVLDTTDGGNSVLEQDVIASVGEQRRRRVSQNHTGTHLLHAALQKEVSSSIFQAGSKVEPDRLRFDYQFDRPLTEDEIQAIESRINRQIQQNQPVSIYRDVDYDVAVNDMDAVAVFDGEYGDTVRVVSIGENGEASVELCGGTHSETAELNLFRIVSEKGIGSGRIRIEAVTGARALESYRADRDAVEEVCGLLNTDRPAFGKRAREVMQQLEAQERQIERLSQKIAAINSQKLVDQADTLNGITVVTAEIDVETNQELLHHIDRLQVDLKGNKATALVGACIDGTPLLACMATEKAVEDGLNAGQLINEAASLIKGGGGGHETFARAGGSDPEGLSDAFVRFRMLVFEN